MRACCHARQLHLGGQPVGFAWYSMLGSYKLFRQMAHVSVQIAQLHIATAFHFFISKRFPLLFFPFFSCCWVLLWSTCSTRCRHDQLLVPVTFRYKNIRFVPMANSPPYPLYRPCWQFLGDDREVFKDTRYL